MARRARPIGSVKYMSIAAVIVLTALVGDARASTGATVSPTDVTTSIDDITTDFIMSFSDDNSTAFPDISTSEIDTTEVPTTEVPTTEVPTTTEAPYLFGEGFVAETIGDCARACVEIQCSFLLYESETGTDGNRTCTLYAAEDFNNCSTNACAQANVTVLWDGANTPGELPTAGTNCSTFIYASQGQSFDISILSSDSPCVVLLVAATDTSFILNSTMRCAHNDSCLADDILHIHNVRQRPGLSEAVTACLGPEPEEEELVVVTSSGNFALLVLQANDTWSQAEFLISATTITFDGVRLETAVIDLVFLLDESGSIGSSDFQTEIEFASDLVSIFTVGPDDVQVAAASFDSYVNSQFYLNTYDNKKDVMDALLAIPYTGGGTNIYVALEYARTTFFTSAYGARTDAYKVVILCTDGNSNYDKTVEEATYLKNESVLIFALGVGSVNMALLNATATDLSYVYQADDFDDLHALILAQLTERLVNEFVQDEEPCPACQALVTYDNECYVLPRNTQNSTVFPRSTTAPRTVTNREGGEEEEEGGGGGGGVSVMTLAVAPTVTVVVAVAVVGGLVALKVKGLICAGGAAVAPAAA